LNVASRPARGLGRGLAGLIDPTAAGPILIDLDVDRIVPNHRQPRRRFDEASLVELTRSVAQDGVVQPVVVRERGDGQYELIAGERRWRAARAAGLVTIPAVVRVVDQRSSLLLALVENVLREDLGPVEVARGYAALADEFGLGAGEIAERVGKSRAAVTNTLRLLELPDDVLAAVDAGTLSEGHGRAILQAEGNEARRVIAHRAARDGLSVRQTEALARAAGAPTTKRLHRRGAPGWLEPELVSEAIDASYRAFGLPARVGAGGGACRLELTVRSHDELVRLVERLEAVAGLAETHIL
jgi:ParB family transcriptional regulator, chromosome partitioning protein